MRKDPRERLALSHTLLDWSASEEHNHVHVFHAWLGRRGPLDASTTQLRDIIHTTKLFPAAQSAKPAVLLVV